MKVLSLFSGIGAFEKALDRLNVNYELVNFCEFDKYAVKSYCAIHGVDESKNLGDITKVDEKALPKNIDLVTYGFPCQDISLAGKQKGLFNEDGTQTRSGLFFEALRIIEETQPKVAIAENVKNLTSKKFNAQFQIVLESLEQAGYNNYWQVLNAKDYGIPQNRERVFIVSIRKDVDTGVFQFPEPISLGIMLKDLLEIDANEKYFLSGEQIENVKINDINALIYDKSMIGFEGSAREYNDFMPAITAREFKEPRLVNMSCIQVADLNHYNNDQMNRVYSPNGVSPAILVKSGGGRETKILVREATKQGYAEAIEGDSINLEQPNSTTRRGRVGKQVAQTITTSPQQAAVLKDLKIRKLTPRECFRLMDFDDEDFEKAEAVNSNTQLYKQAGNSIVVAIPHYIFKALIEANILIEKENNMELRVNDYQLPGQILFNYEELKKELTEKVQMYETLVYTDDQIKQAKADKANLNKLKKALNDERIRREREYLQPFNDFKSKINEIISIIDKPVAVIDRQVKEYEESSKMAKRNAICEFWNTLEVPEWLKLKAVFDQKWLNASVSMKSVQGAIEVLLEQIGKDLSTLSNLPEFGFEASEVYKSTLDINRALNEGKRLSEIQKKKAEHEAEQARLAAEAEAKKQEAEFAHHMNPPVEPEPQTIEDIENQVHERCVSITPPKQWVGFKALLTVEDAQALKEFFESRNIHFESI